MRRPAMDTRALTTLLALGALTSAAISLLTCCLVMALLELVRAHGAAVLVRDPAAPGALALLGLIAGRTAMTARALLRAWRFRRRCRRDLRHREVTVPTGLRRLAADVGIRRLQMAADATPRRSLLGSPGRASWSRRHCWPN